MGSVTVLVLVLIGVLTGVTTVLFGFGGGFVTVPVIVWVDAAVGPDAGTVAVATSAIVMVVNAAVATAATPRPILARLRGRGRLLSLLAVGGLFGAAAALAAEFAVLIMAGVELQRVCAAAQAIAQGQGVLRALFVDGGVL